MPDKRIRGRKLQRLRRRLFDRQPLCVKCLAKDPPVTRLATQRDHVIAITNGGADTEDNVQPLCDECHDEKTAEDLGHQPARPRVLIGLDGFPIHQTPGGDPEKSHGL